MKTPDLRALRRDVPTSRGTYSAGLVVEVLQIRSTARRVLVCLDGPGFHLGACRRAWLPTHAVGVSERMPAPTRDLRVPVAEWDVAAA